MAVFDQLQQLQNHFRLQVGRLQARVQAVRERSEQELVQEYQRTRLYDQEHGSDLNDR